MLDFYAAVYMKICSELCFLQDFAEKWLRTGDQSSRSLPSFLPPSEDLNKYAVMPELLRQTGLTCAYKFSELLSKYLTGEIEVTAHELWSSCDQVRWAIINELETKLVLMIEEDHVEFHEKEGTILGQDIIDKFPEIKDDAREAGECFAFERYTACVFHLMRILEIILRKFARRLRVSSTIFEKKEWGIILNHIDRKLKYDDRAPLREKRRKDRYRITQGFLKSVKMAWRNNTIHVRADYDAREATKIINAAKLFIEDFAKLP